MCTLRGAEFEYLTHLFWVCTTTSSHWQKSNGFISKYCTALCSALLCPALLCSALRRFSSAVSLAHRLQKYKEEDLKWCALLCYAIFVCLPLKSNYLYLPIFHSCCSCLRDNLFLIVLCRHMALKTKIIWFATEAFFKLVIRNERGQIFH